MILNVGLEHGYEGTSIAWALDFPGCYAAGKDAAEALVRLPQSLVNYADRIARRSAHPWLDLGNFDIRLADVWDVYYVNENYDPAMSGQEARAWFKHDWKPLTGEDIVRALELLAWSRADLLELASELSPEQLDREREGERWSIRGILRHVAVGDWWYLDRLDRAGVERSALPEDVFACLESTRARLRAELPAFAGLELVRGKQAEIWSPRKVLRRALQHELDHIGHISRLILEG